MGTDLVGIKYRAALFVDRFFGIAVKEQPAVLPDGARVAVGDVRQIFTPVIQGDHVPHMPASTGAALHRAGHDDGTRIPAEGGLVAQELEGLGVALADHLGTRIIIEHPDQLPGIAVGGTLLEGVKVIIHVPAYGVLVGRQLGDIPQTGIGRDDGPGVGSCLLHRRTPGSVHVVSTRGTGYGILS